MSGETNKLLIIQLIHPSSQSPSLIESKGGHLGLSSYLFVALPQGPYPMIAIFQWRNNCKPQKSLVSSISYTPPKAMSFQLGMTAKHERKYDCVFSK